MTNWLCLLVFSCDEGYMRRAHVIPNGSLFSTTTTFKVTGILVKKCIFPETGQLFSFVCLGFQSAAVKKWSFYANEFWLNESVIGQIVTIIIFGDHFPSFLHIPRFSDDFSYRETAVQDEQFIFGSAFPAAEASLQRLHRISNVGCAVFGWRPVQLLRLLSTEQRKKLDYAQRSDQSLCSDRQLPIVHPTQNSSEHLRSAHFVSVRPSQDRLAAHLRMVGRGLALQMCPFLVHVHFRSLLQSDRLYRTKSIENRHQYDCSRSQARENRSLWPFIRMVCGCPMQHPSVLHQASLWGLSRLVPMHDHLERAAVYNQAGEFLPHGMDLQYPPPPDHLLGALHHLVPVLLCSATSTARLQFP